MSKAKLLTLLFVAYTCLSWILFFRDERALTVIGSQFYPTLSTWLDQTRQTLLAWKLNTIPTLLFALFIIASFWTYFKTLKEKITLKTAVLTAIFFQIVVFFSYPILSTDIFDYILSDRIGVVYHQNVWTTRPDQFKSDPYFGLADWTDLAKIYGGVNQFFYSSITRVSGDDLLVNLATHKLVVLAFVLASLALVAKISPNNVVTVFWNPLFVLETIGSGHNDILMIFFILLALVAFSQHRAFLVGLSLALATQVKSTTLLLAAFLGLSYLANLDWRRLLKFLLAYGLTNAVIFFIMGVGPLYFLTRVSTSINVYWQSLPMQINRFFPAALPLITAGLVATLTLQGFRILTKRIDPVELYGQTILVYLLFFLAAYWNWYPIWLLTLLPFLPSSRLRPYILAFTFSSLLGYVTYWVSLRLSYQLPIWSVIMYLTVLSGPVVVFFHERFLKKVSL